MLLKASLWADVISGGTVSPPHRRPSTTPRHPHPPPQPQIDKPDQIQKMDITRDSRAAGNQRRGQFSASRSTANGSGRASAPQRRLTTERQRCSPQQHVLSGKSDGGHFYVMRLTTTHLSMLLERTHMNNNPKGEGVS